MMLPQIYLVRHGETEWSRSGRHTSHTDLALTAHGEDQARRLKERLGSLEFSRVFTSPRQRARRTGELAGFAQRMEVSPDLAEWNYGDYEGLTSDVIHGQLPGWDIYRDGCPAGESPDEIVRRADQVVASLQAMRGSIVVFSHGHFLRVLAARWIAQPVGVARHFALGTASLSILGHEHDRADAPLIVQWNENGG